MNFSDFFLLFNAYVLNMGLVALLLIAALGKAEAAHPPYKFFDKCAFLLVKRWVHLGIFAFLCGISTYTQIGIIKKHEKIQEDNDRLYEKLKHAHRLKLEIMCWRGGRGTDCTQFNPEL